VPVVPYKWPAVGEFRNRTAELKRLEDWWAAPDREPMNLYGRRRVGKSWLFRKFAHGKPAVILVADRVAPGQQLSQLASDLEPALGLRPQLDDVAALFRVIYQLGQRRKILVVIDEFPYLLGTTHTEQQGHLAAIQSVMEQMRDSSKLKLILTGSTIAQMESRQAEKSPLHGRLTPLTMWPLPFSDARVFLEVEDPLEQLTRFAIAGGMPRYLSVLSGPSLVDLIAERIVDRHGELFNEPRTLLQTELREPAVYFSILARLSGNPKDATSIAEALRMQTKEVSKYLNTLQSLRLVSRHLPVGAQPDARSTQWRCDDHFVRFWFRFVQPFQAELEAGADAHSHVELEVVPNLADHTAPAFEQVLTAWVRRTYAGRASTVGAWWGPALNALRATKQRFSEEVDVVALHGKNVVAVAEAKWTTKPLDAAVLTSLQKHKLPAMTQAGLTVAGCEIVLASRSGFTKALQELAAQLPSVQLFDAADLIRELS
jgi:AAA+ ATPase superfamily predicted ATPase